MHNSFVDQEGTWPIGRPKGKYASTLSANPPFPLCPFPLPPRKAGGPGVYNGKQVGELSQADRSALSIK